MKRTLTFLILIAMAASLHSAESQPGKLTVAVYDFTGEEGTTKAGGAKTYGARVTALVTADLASGTNLVMLERAELNKALKEQAFGISGLVSSDAAAKIGKITGAKVLVSGHIMKTADAKRILIIANIMGTETGRLFAAKVEGSSDNLIGLTSDLSAKIADTIVNQATNLVAEAEETHTQRLDRIAESIKGTNRPSISVSIEFFNEKGGHWPDHYAEYEFGTVLLRCGFTVIDGKSERKPDIEITGDASTSQESPKGDLTSTHTAIGIKAQERQTGKIIAFDRQECAATDVGHNVSSRESHARAVDELAARLLPLLAK